ncbi:MAG: right-handed parallel beta-helix repeat-containing protein, partial [Bacteroidota bacterium]
VLNDLPLNSEFLGCTDIRASNYDASVPYSNGSCEYVAVVCSACDHVLEPDEFLLDNNELGLNPGAVIGIRGGGERTNVLIRNFNADVEGGEEPFIFVNCDGKAFLKNENSADLFAVRRSSGLRITGTGSPSDAFGFDINGGKVSGFRAYDRTDNIEVDHLEVFNTSIGIWCVTRPTCDGSANRGNYVQENTEIHHNYVHDVQDEGFYIGGSKWLIGFDNNGCAGEKLYQPDLIGVKVYNNRVESTGWDGIQVGGAVKDCEIHHNIIFNYGIEEQLSQQAGIMINPGTVGKIFANHVNNGTGIAIHATGFDNLIYSNLIENIKSDGVVLGDRGPFPDKSYRVVNNTFVNLEGAAFKSNSQESVNNVFYNNLMINVAEDPRFFEKNTETSNNVVTKTSESLFLIKSSNDDYTPGMESDLLDSGFVYTREDIDIDFFSRKRNVGARLDIGAFENQEADDQ